MDNNMLDSGTASLTICVSILTSCTASPTSQWSPQQTALNCSHHPQLTQVYRGPGEDMDISMHKHTYTAQKKFTYSEHPDFCAQHSSATGVACYVFIFCNVYYFDLCM